MLNAHLPISDKARERLWRFLWIAYVALFIPMLCLNDSFYSLGSLTPDPQTGRTFPVNEHGILYVLPWEGELANWLFWGVALVFVLIAVVNPYRGRLFLLRNED